MLEVIEITTIKEHSRRCLAKCKCGSVREYILTKVLHGSTQSCGCTRGEKQTTHGMSNTRLGRIFKNMLSRCYNPKFPQYKNYGGRPTPIKICNDWVADRGKFFEWALANGYADNLELDRRENSGDYTPENCRFVTRIVNSNNRRDNVLVSYNGINKTASEFARELGLRPTLITDRLRCGWTIEKIIERFT